VSKAKKPKDPYERIRKVGQREETIERRLTDIEKDDLHQTYLALGNQRQDLEDKKAEVMANYNAQFKAIDLQADAARRLLNARRKSDVGLGEEWLNASNEIVRIRTDTQEQLGDPRKARADELQENLFQDPPADTQAEGAPPEDEAIPQGEAVPEEEPAEDDNAFAAEQA
jgi:hypothetical protein